MYRFLFLYLVIFLGVLIVNLFRYIRCSYYQVAYNRNFSENTARKNFKIEPYILPLLRKGNVVSPSRDIALIADHYYISDYNNAFERAKGHFLRCAKSAIIWPTLATDSLTAYIAIKKANSILIKILLFLFQNFVTYLLALFLDTSGIGNKTLTFLHAALTRVFAHLQGLLH